ncbi:MAG: hypothetical protein NT036_05255 [Candidatus Omnitrophica bacterium]|nr:hypothetical protein [Candidatus Omnitrophota bacterium]
MKAVVFVSVFLVLLLLSAVPSYSESIDSISSSVRTPEELAGWLSQNIDYEFTFGSNSPNTIQDILDSKKGNCEDFALLVSEGLNRLEIENKIIVLKARGIPFSHAVCVWKNNDGTYSFTSNAELYNTKEKRVEDAMAKCFPEYDKILNYSEVRIAWRR